MKTENEKIKRRGWDMLTNPLPINCEDYDYWRTLLRVASNGLLQMKDSYPRLSTIIEECLNQIAEIEEKYYETIEKEKTTDE